MKNTIIRIYLVVAIFAFALSAESQPFTPVHTGLIASFSSWIYNNTSQRTGDATQGDCINLYSGGSGSVISPSINLTTCGSTPYLTFKFRREGTANSNARVGVEISTTGAAGPWTSLGNFTPASSSWYNATPVNLSAYSSSSNVRIRFIANNSPSSSKYPVIDDIHIYCSTPPANDNCAGAISLTVGVAGVCSPTSGTVNYATQSSPASTCGGTPNNDVWYKFVATSTRQIVQVTPGTYVDAVVELMSGSCAGLTSLVCRDAALTGGVETIDYTGFVVGSTYYVRVYDYYSAIPVNGAFSICVSEASSSASNCSNATPIACGTTLTGQTNLGTVNDAGSWGCHVDGLGNSISTLGEDRFYSITTTAAGYVRLTLSNVTAVGTSYLELIALGSSCTAGTCSRSAQLDVSTGLFTSNGLNSWDFDVPAAGTYYFVIDAQGSGSVLNWNISAECYATGIRLDDQNSCGATYGTGNANQGIYTTWNGLAAPNSYDASHAGTYNVCENIYLRNNGWEWIKSNELTVGSCWTNIRNMTPTGNNFAFYAANNANCNPVEGWSATVVGNTITYSFLHPDRYTTSCTNVSTWGDGNLLASPYTCALYRFCFTADIDPTCVDVGGLRNVISATDDGIGGGGSTMASNVLLTYPWSRNATSLPVSLINFRASCQGSETTLYWATATELNNDYFTIERSYDGKSFEKIFTVPGAANSNDINTYSINDAEFKNAVYYRLSQTDFDGTCKILKTIFSDCNNSFQMNPVLMNNCSEGFVQVQFNSIVEKSYLITVIDVNGKLVYQQVIKATDGISSFIVPVDNWSKGVYTYSLKDDVSVIGDKFFIE